MATVLKDYTTEEQSSVVPFFFFFFCEQNDSVQRIFINRSFLFKMGSVWRVKRFATWSRMYLKDVRKSQMMPDHVQKWLRQQPEDFYLCCGFRRTGKAMGQSVLMSVEHISKIKFFFLRYEYHVFYVLYPFVTYLLTLPRTILAFA
jgi:hypothetical protein